MSGPAPDEELVSTPAAAKEAGVSAKTLQRYVRQGLVTPARTLPSGQYRWRLSEVRAQMDAISEAADAKRRAER